MPSGTWVRIGPEISPPGLVTTRSEWAQVDASSVQVDGTPQLCTSSSAVGEKLCLATPGVALALPHAVQRDQRQRDEGGGGGAAHGGRVWHRCAILPRCSTGVLTTSAISSR